MLRHGSCCRSPVLGPPRSLSYLRHPRRALRQLMVLSPWPEQHPPRRVPIRSSEGSYSTTTAAEDPRRSCPQTRANVRQGSTTHTDAGRLLGRPVPLPVPMPLPVLLLSKEPMVALLQTKVEGTGEESALRHCQEDGRGWSTATTDSQVPPVHKLLEVGQEPSTPPLALPHAQRRRIQGPVSSSDTDPDQRRRIQWPVSLLDADPDPDPDPRPRRRRRRLPPSHPPPPVRMPRREAPLRRSLS